MIETEDLCKAISSKGEFLMNSSVIVMIIVVTQIIAESLPISSSGHMNLVEKLLYALGFGSMPVLPEFFDHFLHGPTIIVLVMYFWRAWYELFRLLLFCTKACITNMGKKIRDSWCRLYKIFFKILGFIIIADGITVVFYYMFKKYSMILFGDFDSTGLLLAGFVITTGLLLSLRWVKTLNKTLTRSHAVALGVTQGLAMLPGISRFGSTYVIARWFGISHRRAFQISFLLFFPLVVAAFFVNGIPEIWASDIFKQALNPWTILIWMVLIVGATIVSFYALKLADYMGTRQKLWLFGVYMLVPVLITLMLLFLGY